MKTLPMAQPDPMPVPDGREETPGAARFADVMPDPAQTEALRPAIVAAVSTVFDPEIPVNIWELGLIYDVTVDKCGVAGVLMTLTAPGCPAAQSLPVEVHQKVEAVPGVTGAKVEVVWEPAWTKDRMSEAARLQLGLW